MQNQDSDSTEKQASKSASGFNELNNYIGAIIKVTTKDGMQVLGLNDGFDEESHKLSLKRAGSYRSFRAWFPVFEISEEVIYSVMSATEEELHEYLKPARDSLSNTLRH